MSPDVYSRYAWQWGLGRSLPERLFEHYERSEDRQFKDAHVMFLIENYRCHEEILRFPSDNFYGKQLVCRGSEVKTYNKNFTMFYWKHNVRKPLLEF